MLVKTIMFEAALVSISLFGELQLLLHYLRTLSGELPPDLRRSTPAGASICDRDWRGPNSISPPSLIFLSLFFPYPFS